MVGTNDRNEKRETILVSNWIPIVGNWKIEAAKAVFTGPEDATFKQGIALCDVRTTNAFFRLKAEIGDVEGGYARLAFGHDTAVGGGYSIGLGGYDRAFVLNSYVTRRRSRLIRGVGRKENLQAKRAYQLDIRLEGSLVRLEVDGVEVLEHNLPHPLTGDQVGIVGYGHGQVTFSDLEVTQVMPRAFVVMQYTEPYESLWKEVIEPVARRVGFDPYRAADVFTPGVVLQDIVRGISTSQAIIAEVTPNNPNVYYELGYAHALGTPTVLLAQKPKEGDVRLPFDISGFRVIFYDDAIRGKGKVEESLEKHLRNIKEPSQEKVLVV
jgi:hypothetical protein